MFEINEDMTDKERIRFWKVATAFWKKEYYRCMEKKK